MRNRLRGKSANAAAGFLALCLLLATPIRDAGGNGGSPDLSDISLGYMASTFLGMETEEAKNILRTWVDRFHKSHVPGGRSRIHIFRDLSGMEEALREKLVEVACTASDDFIRLRKRASLQPLMVSARREGGVYQRMMVLVRRDSGFRGLRDLQGKRIVIAGDKGPSINHLWLETITMRDVGRTPSGFFFSVREASKPSQAVLAVFFRQADACLTYRRLFEEICAQNPQVRDELAVLVQSEKLATGVVSVRADLHPGKKKWLADVLGGMDRTPSGKQVLQIHRVDYFLPFREEYLSSVEALVEEHDRLLAIPAAGS